ncbi:Na(+)/H(+) exchange regulatory cofactor NHE-RF2 [Dissostichus eleginoides]|uniref:Na(+)/H(+) exchange regulatory cofactor NHE-RF2 n=1 Tax=Dissostichus eleginoides TaxID=100907 RepID=A0AAD9BNC0_DISEL|nr:Na(+)/H(+) exchange regulatory cofactor NHE-RF2 [Dissostichus eleginoides]
MESELRPRLCFLTKGEQGYGFHLHGERNRGGQFIRKVEPGSSSDMAGLRPGDRVVEVNGENVENEAHHQVVDRIREVSYRTRLLVVDKETDEHLRSRGLACTEDLAIEMGTLSPQPSPAATPSTSPSPRGNSPMSPKPNYTQSFFPPAADSSIHTITQDKAKRFSVTSCTATDPELQEHPSPEPSVELCPRLCHLRQKKGGQFVRSVDPGSAAESADIRPGDRIVEVNGMNISTLRHSEVVALIREGGGEVRFLVVDQETYDFFQIIRITPTVSHVKEVYLEESVTESSPPTPSPTTELPARTTNNKQISSSDMSIQVHDEDDRRVSDPFMESGLRLSPTAAEAKKKALSSRKKKRAPAMNWSKKQEIFSSF